ncbi:MAG: isocitrate dehydrogenase [Myxococcales bacterium]|nr:isocitrate dehydrogenase [Myxococcales bacterium]
MSHLATVAVLQGGPTSDALSDAVQQVIAAAGLNIQWRTLPAGVRAVEQSGDPMPPETIDAIRSVGLCLKPLLRTPVGKGYTSPNVTLRQKLGVFAGVRAIRSLNGITSRYQNVDLVLVRELTEGTYAGIEHTIIPGVVETIKVMTQGKAEQVIRFAFDEARRRGRRTVTVVHKANIMKMSDGLFRNIGRQIALDNKDIEHRDIIADNAAMQMVARPEQFDVLVAGNLFGDILGDIGAGLVGSSLLVTSVNAADSVKVFEATQHVGRTRNPAGEISASPLALLMPALDLLEHLEEHEAAQRIRQAASDVLCAKARLTVAHGGISSTSEMTAAIIDRLNASSSA